MIVVIKCTNKISSENDYLNIHQVDLARVGTNDTDLYYLNNILVLKKLRVMWRYNTNNNRVSFNTHYTKATIFNVW